MMEDHTQWMGSLPGQVSTMTSARYPRVAEDPSQARS